MDINEVAPSSAGLSTDAKQTNTQDNETKKSEFISNSAKDEKDLAALKELQSGNSPAAIVDLSAEALSAAANSSLESLVTGSLESTFSTSSEEASTADTEEAPAGADYISFQANDGSQVYTIKSGERFRRPNDEASEDEGNEEESTVTVAEEELAGQAFTNTIQTTEGVEFRNYGELQQSEEPNQANLAEPKSEVTEETSETSAELKTESSPGNSANRPEQPDQAKDPELPPQANTSAHARPAEGEQ